MSGDLSGATATAALAELPSLGERTDPLTRFPDRRDFLTRLRSALAAPRRNTGSVAILLADLDGFRRINRERGHGVGDELLFAAARRIVAAADSGDVVARAGGDEFLVMTWASPGDGRVHALARRLIEAFADPFDLDGEPFTCSLSVGVAFASAAETSAEALVAEAESALEQPPRTPRRLRLFDVGLREKLRARSRLGADLAAALRDGEVSLAYQPIVHLPSGRIAAVEALARWRRPERGHVSPQLFVSVADESGAGEELLAAVLDRAASDFAEIAAADASGRIALAFNVSAAQLASESLLAGIARLSERSGVPRERIVVEISESALSGRAQRYLRRVEELRSLGVRISLDDFGTASTSIAQLRSLPVDQIKLDRSFVAGLGEGTEDAALAAGLLPMARTLGIDVVAEGIETDQQLAHLFALGYRQGQGYRFAVAASPTTVTALIREGPLPALGSPQGSEAARLREAFEAALIAGDARRADAIVAEAVDAGLGAMTIQTEVIGRALQLIGAAREAGRLAVADEQLASAICERQLAAVFAALRPRRRPRFDRRVLLGALRGAGADAGLKRAAETLGSEGYETVSLGTNVRAENLAEAAGTHQPRAVCLTLPAPVPRAELDRTLAGLAGSGEPPLVLVDGAGAAAIDRRSGAIPVSSPEDALAVLAAEIAARERR